MLDGQKDPIFNVRLTDKEIAVWNKITAMEASHNELMANLGEYRDNMIAFRNNFVEYLRKKYNLTSPAHMQIDPVTKTIVSVFDPKARAYVFDTRPKVFKDAARSSILLAIEELLLIYKQTHEGGF
jgi:hypothetical protein